MSICRSIGLLAIISTLPFSYQGTWLIPVAHAESTMPSASLIGSQSILADGKQSYTFHAPLSSEGNPLEGASGTLRLIPVQKAVSRTPEMAFTAYLSHQMRYQPQPLRPPPSTQNKHRSKGSWLSQIKLLPPSVKLVEFTSDPAELLLGADENATLHFDLKVALQKTLSSASKAPKEPLAM